MKTEKYVAFIENGFYVGFTTKNQWVGKNQLWKEDIDVVVEFEGPSSKEENGYNDDTFEELKVLAAKAAREAGYRTE